MVKNFGGPFSLVRCLLGPKKEGEQIGKSRIEDPKASIHAFSLPSEILTKEITSSAHITNTTYYSDCQPHYIPLFNLSGCF